jgi:hypothetical protein
MADVSVEFGAVDVGLEKTLKKIREEVMTLQTKVKSGELSMEELETTMRRVGQVESMEKRIKGMGQAADSATADFKQLDAAIDSVQAEQAGGGFGAIAGGIGKVAAGLTSAYAAIQGFSAAFRFVGDSVTAASDLGETTSKVGQIFGSTSTAIQEWAKTAATSLGQTAKQAMDAASTFAIFGKSAGLSGNSLVSFSTNLTGLATDLASFENTSVDEAILAIGAALRGESEPIRRFGVMLDDASLKAKAMEMGLYDGKGALDLQVRSLAAYNLILEQTKIQQGDFQRTNEGLAGQTKILTAEVQTLKAELGTGLLPAVNTLVSYLNDTAVPAVYGLKKVFDDSVISARGFAKSLGFSDQSLSDASKTASEATPVFKTALGSVFPLAGAFFKTGDALDFLAKKGKEARGETTDTSKAIEGVGNSSKIASEQLTKTSLETAKAAGEFKEAGEKADTAGQSMAESFSLGADFKPQIEGIAEGWSDVGDKIAGTKPLLEGNFSLADSIAGKTDEQAQSIGGVNDEAKVSSDIMKDIEKSVAATDKKLEEQKEKQKKANEEKQASLQLDLQIAEALAGGNEEQAKALQYQKDFNGYLKQAIDAGMGEPEANKFAAAMAKAAGSAKGIKDDLSESAKLFKSIEEARAKDAVDKGGKNTKAAQDAIARGDFAGAERAAGRIARKEESIAQKAADKQAAEEFAALPFAERVAAGQQSFRDSFAKKDTAVASSDVAPKSLKDRQAEANASFREKFAKKDTAVDRPGQSGQTASQASGSDQKSGGGLEGLVEGIKTLLEKIEPRLPVAALTA